MEDLTAVTSNDIIYKLRFNTTWKLLCYTFSKFLFTFTIDNKKIEMKFCDNLYQVHAAQSIIINNCSLGNKLINYRQIYLYKTQICNIRKFEILRNNFIDYLFR